MALDHEATASFRSSFIFFSFFFFDLSRHVRRYDRDTFAHPPFHPLMRSRERRRKIIKKNEWNQDRRKKKNRDKKLGRTPMMGMWWAGPPNLDVRHMFNNDGSMARSVLWPSFFFFFFFFFSYLQVTTQVHRLSLFFFSLFLSCFLTCPFGHQVIPTFPPHDGSFGKMVA